MGLFLLGNGVPRSVISVFSRLGLSESYAMIVAKDGRSKKQRDQDEADRAAGMTVAPPKGGTLVQLSNSCRDNARKVASDGLGSEVFDNMNLTFNNTEQVMGRHGML